MVEIRHGTPRIFLAVETSRPSFGGVAFNLYAMRNVLKKCGRPKIGTDTSFAIAPQVAIVPFALFFYEFAGPVLTAGQTGLDQIHPARQVSDRNADFRAAGTQRPDAVAVGTENFHGL